MTKDRSPDFSGAVAGAQTPDHVQAEARADLPGTAGPEGAVVSLRELVAANVRRLRTATGAKPEDIARAAVHVGMEWTPAWVVAVERAQKPLSAEQLLALPFVLTAALGHRIGLADLLLGEVDVLIGKTAPVQALHLREMVTEKPFKLYFSVPRVRDAELAERRRLAGAQAAEKVRLLGQANLGDVDARALQRAEAGSGDAETKLARKLGVPEIVVVAAAASLWGRSMTEERDALLQHAEGEVAGPSKATVSKRLATAVAERITAAAESAAAQPGGPTRLVRIVRPRPG